MVGLGRTHGCGNQDNQGEMAELRRKIADLLRAVQDLHQRREPVAARMDIPEGEHDPSDVPEGSLEAEIADLVDDNPFHATGPANNVVRGGLEERLVHTLELNGGGIRIEVVDFHRKMHVEDYLGWEASLETYFEWKPMYEARKVLFVKLKLKSSALQWWKRVEEQRAR
ncbi:hypothetical protein K2173_023308 [Erythroxylum novogranatense]|uniref:Retrotransposon gag domain-containing protein n=1 Tax=Erythroxylum novogranatense TaxID=1862640 RepID=A0AAV8TA94_9ROSI|nr:hypothetical protein K2173_023308 [Erythroxylum novogranatense]